MPPSPLMWRYTLRDLTDDDDPEAWARALADEGWQLWPNTTGAMTTINGRRVRRYSLRRWEAAPTPPHTQRTGQEPAG